MNDTMPPIPSRITDDEVARLPVHTGRADLLEDLMATPVTDRNDQRPTRSRRPASAWLVVPAAAAAIAAIALVPVLRGGSDGPSPDRPGPAGSSGTPSTDDSSSLAEQHRQRHSESLQKLQRHSKSLHRAAAAHTVRSVPGGRYVALDEPGWTVSYVYEGNGETDISYTKGDLSLELVQYPAASYQTYYVDRQHVSKAADTTLIGKPSSTFTYSAQDHATIRPAEGQTFLEARGSGMDLTAYDALLDQVVQTDERGFADAMPEDVVTPFNRDRAVAHLLEGVTVPDGFTAGDVAIEGFNDAYQSAATVAGSVGCAWLDVYAGGGAAARQRALEAFDGSTGWPLLQAIDGAGGYSGAFWSVARDLRAGESAEGLRGGIC